MVRIYAKPTWNTDGEEVDLPDSVEIDVELIEKLWIDLFPEPEPFDLESALQDDWIIETITNKLSDKYGWLIDSLSFDTEEE